MPTVLDGPMRKVALQLINKFGEPITYIHRSASNYDPTTRTADPDTSPSSIKGYFTKVDQRLVDGTKIKMTDEMVLVAASGMDVTPDTNGQVTRGVGDAIKTLSVQHVDTVKSGELAAIHTLVVRG